MNANGPKAASLPAAAFVRPGIVRQFLVWAQRADAEARAEAASALTRAYLHSDLTPELRAEAAIAATALLDDPSPIVRRALAEALSGASEAPRHLVLALAADQSDVAAAVLQRSPVLTAAELAICAAAADVVAQSALARRPNLAPTVIAALIEGGERDAIVTLVGNGDIDLSPDALTRIVARFDGDAGVREALLERPFLPASLRARIAIATAKDLSVAAARWLPGERAGRVAREAREQALSSIAHACRPGERAALVRTLRECSALTPSLLMRSLLGGERDLFAAAMAELSGVPLARVAAFMLKPRREGFAAVARRAGLKRSILPAFAAALAAVKSHRRADGEGLKLMLVRRVVDECERRDDPALARVLALLWRFAGEAARAEAAGFARAAIGEAQSARLPQSLDFAPANDDAGARPKADIGALDPQPMRLRPGVFDEPSEGPAPRLELPADLIARLDDAA